MQPCEAPIEPSTESQRFMQHVDERLAGQRLAPDTDINRTIAAVLSVLAQRLSGAKAQQLEETLGGIVPFPEGTDASEGFTEGSAFGFDEFVARVVQQAGATEDAAHRVTQAVFGELRRQLPAETLRSIASRLPSDILAIWTSPETGKSSQEASRQEPEPATTPELPADLLAASHPLLQRIEAEVELPPPLNGAAAFAATMCLLMLRLGAEQATELRRRLPDALQDLLFRCTQEREEDATRFGEAEFLEALGAELGAPTDVAEQVALGVFRVVCESLPPDDVKRIASQLPKGLNVLWSGGHLGRVKTG
jgi:uncharacterized protein (DUF2267 family)